MQYWVLTKDNIIFLFNKLAGPHYPNVARLWAGHIDFLTKKGHTTKNVFLKFHNNGNPYVLISQIWKQGKKDPTFCTFKWESYFYTKNDDMQWASDFNEERQSGYQLLFPSGIAIFGMFRTICSAPAPWGLSISSTWTLHDIGAWIKKKPLCMPSCRLRILGLTVRFGQLCDKIKGGHGEYLRSLISAVTIIHISW